MRTGRDYGIIAAGLLVTIMLLFGCPHWLHYDRWGIAFIHHFFHANLFHLAVNCFSLYILFKNDNVTALTIISAYICATLSWFCSSADPIGASNFIFAMMGLRTPRLSHAWWRHPSTIIFFATNMAMAFLPQVSAVTHIVSFILGCLCSILFRFIHTLTYDFRRATYHR